MNGHWSEYAATMGRYQGIESQLEVQRPIAFLIATNRNFHLEAFCDSLLESLRGSRVPLGKRVYFTSTLLLRNQSQRSCLKDSKDF